MLQPLIRLLPILVDSLTFLSLVLLAVPAWHFNHYAQLSAKLSQLRIQPKVPALAKRYKELKEKAVQLRDEWKPWKARLLLLGTLAGALAAILSLVDHLRSYWSPAYNLPAG